MSKCFELGCPFPAVDTEGCFCKTHAHDRAAEMSPVGCSGALGDSSGRVSYTEFTIGATIRKVDAQRGRAEIEREISALVK